MEKVMFHGLVSIVIRPDALTKANPFLYHERAKFRLSTEDS